MARVDVSSASTTSSYPPNAALAGADGSSAAHQLIPTSVSAAEGGADGAGSGCGGFSPASGSQGASSDTPSGGGGGGGGAGTPDLSYLTAEERAIIAGVMHRQHDEENKEVNFLRQAEFHTFCGFF